MLIQTNLCIHPAKSHLWHISQNIYNSLYFNNAVVICLLLSFVVIFTIYCFLDFVRHGPRNQLLCQCGRYYNTMNRLMLHQSEECQDFKRFQCDYCLKWFKRRSHLNRHKKLHQAVLAAERRLIYRQNQKQKLVAEKTTTTQTATETTLQQLASISTARSLQHLVPHLPHNLHIDTSSLVAGRKLPRQSSKRLPPYESNRCPLCARVYRSQAFLNEHMRNEHSVLI
ncbi:zinc finger protein 667-like [Drosophila novamexicana]|uniref:zinc finger protein 667-like n=1 Tax=Drosophila novamexicana TaxID=47314 RepID=UPI0011E5BE93|nr:zinc finger protein 667-like [Drosophila novamexicana]